MCYQSKAQARQSRTGTPYCDLRRTTYAAYVMCITYGIRHTSIRHVYTYLMRTYVYTSRLYILDAHTYGIRITFVLYDMRHTCHEGWSVVTNDEQVHCCVLVVASSEHAQYEGK